MDARGGDITIGNTGVGTLYVTNPTGNPTPPSLTTNDYVYLGRAPAGDGTVILSGGTWDANDLVYVGDQGKGKVNVNADAQWTTNEGVYLGRYADGSGTVNVSGGTWDAKGDVLVGNEGTGEVNVTGGTMNLAGNLSLGSQGTLTLNGGTIHVDAATHLDLSSSASKFRFLTGNLNVAGQLTWNNALLGSGQHVQLTGSSALWQPSNATFLAGSSLTIDSGTLGISDNGYAIFASALQLTENGGTVVLDHAQLNHTVEMLDLNNGEIRGSGQIFVGTEGLDLGASGSLHGTSDTERLTVYGDLSGSGSVTNVLLFGNLEVGNSPGLLNLESTTVGDTSTITMEIAGTELPDYDRIVLGPNVDFGEAAVTALFTDGFTPQSTDTFQLFWAGAGGDLYGALSDANFAAPDGWVLDPQTGLLQVIPEPSTLTLAAVALLALAFRSRRRKKGTFWFFCKK